MALVPAKQRRRTQISKSTVQRKERLRAWENSATTCSSTTSPFGDSASYKKLVFASNPDSVPPVIRTANMEQRLTTWVLTMLLAFGPFVSVASANSSWKPCSATEDYRVTVRDVKVSPDPVVRGGAATFEIPAVTSETIAGGRVTVQVYFLGVPVHTEKGDLCAKTSCPIAPGEFSLSNSEGLPDFTPTGSYRLEMRVQDEGGDLLTCLKINFQITTPDVQSE